MVKPVDRAVEIKDVQAQKSHAEEHHLDVDFEVARSVHRVVRAMHNGECPACQAFVDAEEMRRGNGLGLGKDYLICPVCRYTITPEEQQAAITLFGRVMAKNLLVFEKWRKTLQ